MSWATVRRDIEKRLQDNWATTVVAYDNVEFDPPRDAPWVRLRIMEEPTVRKTIGRTATHRSNGTIVLDVNVLKDRGTQQARNYAATLGTLFRDVQFSGITCREASLVNAGEVEGWYRFSVLIPFYWDGVYP